MEAKIKPQDLRIGNLVYGVSDRIEKVVCINEDKLTTKHYTGEFDNDYECEIEYFSPIAISEDILKRMGYTNNGQNIFDHPEGYFSVRLMYGKATTLGRDIRVLEIKGTHHLQNLVYDLYDGSELTITDINIEG